MFSSLCVLHNLLYIDAPWTVLLANIEPDSTAVTVNGLIPARSYQFRLCAVNDVGKGQFSKETDRWADHSVLKPVEYHSCALFDHKDNSITLSQHVKIACALMGQCLWEDLSVLTHSVCIRLYFSWMCLCVSVSSKDQCNQSPRHVKEAFQHLN